MSKKHLSLVICSFALLMAMNVQSASGCSATISGPSQVEVGSSGLWQLNLSNCSGSNLIVWGMLMEGSSGCFEHDGDVPGGTSFFRANLPGQGFQLIAAVYNSSGSTLLAEDDHRVSVYYDYPTPTPVYQIGFRDYYPSSALYSSFNSSGRQFCKENFGDTYLSYGIHNAGYSGGVYSWWNGSSWSTTGNNWVFFMEDLRCASIAPHC